LVTCPHCGEATPGENLNCIYCGNLLNRPLGAISALALGWKGWLGVIFVLLVIVVFLSWIL